MLKVLHLEYYEFKEGLYSGSLSGSRLSSLALLSAESTLPKRFFTSMGSCVSLLAMLLCSIADVSNGVIFEM